MNKQTDAQQNTVEAHDRTMTDTTNAASDSIKTGSTQKQFGKDFTPKSTMITGVALVVALLSLGGTGFIYWHQKNQNTFLAEQNQQLTNKLESQQLAVQQMIDNAKKQEALLNTQLANTQTKLKTLETEATTLKVAQEKLINQIAKVNTDSSQTWMLFEAKQLLKQTFFRLRASDISGASKLLEDLNETIKQRGDLSQAASKVNQAIEVALLKLQQTKQANLANLYSQLAAIQTQIAELPIKAPQFNNTANSAVQPSSRWEKLSNKLSNYVRIDFNANSKILPILTSQGIVQLKMTLNLSIEKAQWAALSGEPSIYTDELNRVSQFLNEYFDANSIQVKTLLNKINHLKNEVIIVEVPDLTDTLKVINNYLDAQIAVASQTKTTQPIKGGN